MFNRIQHIDWLCLSWLQKHMKCRFLDFIMPKITALGDAGALWLITAVALLFTKRYRPCGIIMLIGVTVGFVIGNLILKPLFGRPRPCWLDETVHLLIPKATDFSFPSGHTLASVIAAGILVLFSRNFGYTAIAVAALIAFSRLYLYQHFPTDVLASILLGTLIAWGTYRITTLFFPLAASAIPAMH